MRVTSEVDRSVSPGTAPLTFATTAAATEWISPRLESSDRSLPRVGRFVPHGYDRYVRLWHPVENSAGQRFLGRLAEPVLVPLIDHLGAGVDLATVTAWFAFWEGWGDLNEGLAALMDRRTWTSREVEAATFAFDEYRTYVLLTGPLGALLTARRAMFRPTPQLWWPDDHGWFVASEIDFGLTLVGADDPTAAALLSDPALECDEVHWGDVLTTFGD